MFWPAVIDAGPLFTIERSACGASEVLALAVLFADDGSLAPEVTVAVFVTEAPATFAGMLKVALMVAVCPAVIVPRLQGNGVVQAPLFETNVVPAGAGSLTLTLPADAGPPFVTVMVYVTFCPGLAEVGPVLVMNTSAGCATFVFAVELLSPVFGSFSVAEMVAVFAIVAPV
jgi:hypothetical protein